MTNQNYIVVSFYKYLNLDDLAALQKRLLNYSISIGLTGKIYLASEGINGSIFGLRETVDAFKNELSSINGFDNIWFKESVTNIIAFTKMHVRIKKELVNLGIDGLTPNNGGKRLSPEELKNFYESKKDFVIVDTRNSWESNIGRFKNAVTPSMHTFRDWKSVADKLEVYKDKTIVTYCTGGIRCEKASAYLVQKGFKDVYQLNGGILNYINNYPDTYWEGAMFVFDDRRIVEPNTKEELKYIANCHHCGNPTSYHINCHNIDCDKLIVCCNECKIKFDYSCSESCMKASNRRNKRYG